MKICVRIISLTLCLVFIVLTAFSFSACSSKAPEISEVRERFIYLIEQSKDINEIFFGAGLPVYVRESDLAQAKFVYVGAQNQGYERVMENSTYFYIDAIKAQAEQVYTSEYCEALFQSCFEGVLVDGVTMLEYAEISDWLYQSTAHDELVKHERIYDYSTMRIVKPSSGEYVNVEIDSYLISEPENVKCDTLSFAYEDGNWYLDTPTY